MKKLKLRPKVEKSMIGYFISSPVYAGVNGDYLSHWQQTPPYYFRLGNLENWLKNHIIKTYSQNLLKEDYY